MVVENRMYQQLHKIWEEKVCRINIFWSILGKLGQNILCTPKKCLFLHLWIVESSVLFDDCSTDKCDDIIDDYYDSDDGECVY